MTSPEAFSAFVDCHVTAPMRAAGYAKIAEYDEVTDSARATPLAAAPPRWRAAQRRLRKSRLPKERVLRVGYEGSDADGGDDEKWLDYFPATEELDAVCWSEEMEGLADWDVWDDRTVPTSDELERRLRVAGEAMRRCSNG